MGYIATDVLPGSIITYRVAAEDNNTLSGRVIGYSNELKLEIIGFKDKHYETLEGIKK